MKNGNEKTKYKVVVNSIKREKGHIFQIPEHLCLGELGIGWHKKINGLKKKLEHPISSIPMRRAILSF